VAPIAIVCVSHLGLRLHSPVAFDAAIHIEIHLRFGWWSRPLRHVTMALDTIDLPEQDMAPVGKVDVPRNGVDLFPRDFFSGLNIFLNFFFFGRHVDNILMTFGAHRNPWNSSGCVILIVLMTGNALDVILNMLLMIECYGLVQRIAIYRSPSYDDDRCHIHDQRGDHVDGSSANGWKVHRK
jgi:hypothetical protein